MSLFKKNPNEAAYVEGKKHIVDVIKNSGPGELLIWRQPEEDFNVNSTLIVMPGEEAIFVNEGKIEAVYGNGTYKLDTNNTPFLGRLRTSISGGISSFNCVVYFVRTAVSVEIKWGTETPIQVRDNVYGIRTEVKARGAYKVIIGDASTFLTKLIGNNVDIETQNGLNKYFATEFQGKIKTAISKYLQELNRELIGIDAEIETVSSSLEVPINEILKEYGITCAKFVVSALDVDTSKYDEIDKTKVESIQKTMAAQADKNVMETLGEDWSRQKNYEIYKDVANNQGQSIAGAGMAMGLGVGLGDALSKKTTKEETTEDPFVTLEKMKKMLDAGLITEEEYNTKKAEVLKRM